MKLSPQCEAVLQEHDLYPDYDDIAYPEGVRVRDAQGTSLFLVTPRINSCNLKALLAYGKRMREEGVAIGERNVQQRMLEVMGLHASDD